MSLSYCMASGRKCLHADIVSTTQVSITSPSFDALCVPALEIRKMSLLFTRIKAYNIRMPRYEGWVYTRRDGNTLSWSGSRCRLNNDYEKRGECRDRQNLHV